MVSKRFKTVSKFINDVKEMTRNETETLSFLNIIFRGDNRFVKAKTYISAMELDSEPFTILSPAGYLKVYRVK